MNAYSILVGKPKGKRPLGRPRCRWVDSIKIDLGELLWDGMDWIDLAQGRDQWRDFCEHGNGPSGSIDGKFLSSCRIGGFSRRAELHE
jgi:hypothetical protein